MRSILLPVLVLAACSPDPKGTATVSGAPTLAFPDHGIPADGAACAPSTEAPRFPLAEAYVRDLGQLIMRASPETFHGDYAPGKICFHVVTSREIGHELAVAEAYTDELTVYVNAENLRDTSLETSVADLLAHEMGHVVLQAMWEVGDAPKSVAADPAWQSALAAVPAAQAHAARVAFRAADVELGAAARSLGQLLAHALPDALDAQARTAFLAAYDKALQEADDEAFNVIHDAALAAAPSPALRAQLADGFTRWTKAGDAFQKEQSAVQALFSAALARRDALVPPESDEGKTWIELHADAVGYEFYLRAGYAKELFFYESKPDGCSASQPSACTANPPVLFNGQAYPDPGYRWMTVQVWDWQPQHPAYNPWLAHISLGNATTQLVTTAGTPRLAAVRAELAASLP